MSNPFWLEKGLESKGIATKEHSTLLRRRHHHGDSDTALLLPAKHQHSINHQGTSHDIFKMHHQSPRNMYLLQLAPVNRFFFLMPIFFTCYNGVLARKIDVTSLLFLF